jgi:rubrerythrin
MWILITIIAGGAVLVAYAALERKFNQRRCASCGYRVSVDALPEVCPRCGAIIEEETA